jgi:cell division protein ZapA (FtsZ GTPase activity inhibitor)
VEELAHSVDQLMHEVAVKAGNVDTARTAVLTCLHLADQKRNLEKEIEQLKQRVEAKARQFSIRLDEALTGHNGSHNGPRTDALGSQWCLRGRFL